MIATARPAITAGRSVTTRLALWKNAGCESQHQNEAQQGRMKSLHGNLLLKLFAVSVFSGTRRQVPEPERPELLRPGELECGCEGRLEMASTLLKWVRRNVAIAWVRLTRRLGKERPGFWRPHGLSWRRAWRPGEHTDRFRRSPRADTSSANTCGSNHDRTKPGRG